MRHHFHLHQTAGSYRGFGPEEEKRKQAYIAISGKPK
jgi:hypothetical protein